MPCVYLAFIKINTQHQLYLSYQYINIYETKRCHNINAKYKLLQLVIKVIIIIEVGQ